jgi:phage I-like protein
MDVSSLYLGLAHPAGAAAAHSEAASAVPEWIQLLPAGIFRGIDGRGPYRVKDPEAVIRASLVKNAGAAMNLPVDENHATDHAMKSGVPSPARGWIDRMEIRDGSIWGHVDWTPSGIALMSEKSYRGISPVFVHLKDGTVTRILRAALTNTPNIGELATLHSALSAEERKALPDEMFAVPGKRELPMRDADHVELAWDMVDRTANLTDAERVEARKRILARAKALGVDTEGWNVSAHSSGAKMDIEAVRAALGLPETADEAACLAAMSAQRETVARQSEQIVGLSKTTVPLDQVVALQSEIAGMKQAQARAVAEAFVDAAIAAGKPIVPVREQLIAQHMSDPALVKAMVEGMPSIHSGRGADGRFLPPSGSGAPGEEAMSDEDMAVCAKMNIEPEALKKWRAEQRKGAK